MKKKKKITNNINVNPNKLIQLGFNFQERKRMRTESELILRSKTSCGWPRRKIRIQVQYHFKKKSNVLIISPQINLQTYKESDFVVDRYPPNASLNYFRSFSFIYYIQLSFDIRRN